MTLRIGVTLESVMPNGENAMLFESLESRQFLSISLNGNPVINVSPIPAQLDPSSAVFNDGDFNRDSLVNLDDFDALRTQPFAVADSIRQSAGAGDANCDRKIDQTDFAAMIRSFNQSGGWTQGDFTLNGQVNIKDFALAASNASR